ncbi:serine O-acetyltransferase [Clostridium akagii]|uniref:serine O-acetyltransferase n=1 Tax=Clostridium akagii TaxID=91623 RepID=UPI000AD33FD5|nr:serine acetyltransferase [Clostridium akagii]
MTAIKMYRIANYLYRNKIPLLPKIFYRLIYLINNCHIHYQTHIGKGTVIAYGGIGVVIHKKAAIGQNCVIESCVTIGGRSNIEKLPVLGDRVFVGTGAKVLGDVKIGNDVIIGANAVVIKDVPDNCIVAGIPAKIIRENVDITKKCNIAQITLGRY